MALVVWTFLPIIWVMVSSVKEERFQFAVPPVLLPRPTAAHYVTILRDAEFMRSYVSSSVIAAGSTLAILALAIPAAYAHAHLRLPYRSISLTLLVGIRAMPPVAIVVPLFLFFQRLRLMDTYQGMVLLYVAFFVSFAVLMLKTFFDSVPQELDDAAAIDGASPARRLLTNLPLVAPGLAATAVLAFVSAWNEFFFAFIFTAREAKTVPVALAMYVGETGIHWGTMTAGATLVMVPSMVLAWTVQRYLVQGLIGGALR